VRIALINYRGEDRVPFLMSDADFSAAIGKLAGKVQHKEVINYGAETKYHYHDFAADSEGLGILTEETDQGGPDWTEWLRSRRSAFDAVAEKWAAVEPKFSRKSTETEVADSKEASDKWMMHYGRSSQVIRRRTEGRRRRYTSVGIL
jgi:hypothetical protein